jgi:dipeptidyl aminopeptidase/acylaminoacyl peptidase
MLSIRPLAAALLTGLLAAPAGAATPRVTVPEDVARFAGISQATISHHGDRIAFVVSRLDVPGNRYKRDLWIVRTDGSGLRQLTRGDAETDPDWSPDDSRLAFTEGRGDDPAQIAVIALGGGEAETITHEAHGASGPHWSHAGTRILYSLTSDDAQPAVRVDAKAAGATLDPKDAKSDVRITDRLDFEVNGAGNTFMHHTHLATVHPDGGGTHRLTPDTPWSETQPAWSPDDRSIAFVSLRRPVDPYRLDSDVYVMPSVGGALHRVALHHAGNTAPTWTHDGRSLYVAFDQQPDPAENAGLAVARVDGSAERTIVPLNHLNFGDAILTDAREGGAGCGPLPDAHDAGVLLDVSGPGSSALLRIGTASGSATPIVARGDELAECSADDALRHIAFVADDFMHPGEIWVHDMASGATHRVTHLNDAVVASLRLAPAQPFTVRDSAGFTVHAWFVPAIAPRTRRAPTLLEIHGGPAAEFGNGFFAEMQMLAGRGYNVVFSDPRGSQGFGYAYQAALNKNWGDPMFDDVQHVMDEVAQRPDVDTSRLGVLGGSYGGYSTLWVVGHTHRYRAAIAERVVSDLTSANLACDECGRTSTSYGFGNAWDNQAGYWHQSPISSIANVTTPMLILHSDNDTRTPLVDTDAWFTLARSLHEPLTYVQVPRENHDLNRTGEPVHRVERLHLIADWFAKEFR